MLWFCLLSFIAGCALFLGLLFCKSHLKFQEAQTEQIHSEHSENSLLMTQTASECCAMLISLEDHKLQLRNRLAMLNEMIEKSDLEIARLQEQLARMDQFRRDPLNSTSREMLNLLRAGGYDDTDIQHLTLRDRDELEAA